MAVSNPGIGSLAPGLALEVSHIPISHFCPYWTRRTIVFSRQKSLNSASMSDVKQKANPSHHPDLPITPHLCLTILDPTSSRPAFPATPDLYPCQWIKDAALSSVLKETEIGGRDYFNSLSFASRKAVLYLRLCKSQPSPTYTGFSPIL